MMQNKKDQKKKQIDRRKKVHLSFKMKKEIDNKKE